MTLLAGDLTTPALVGNWIPNLPSPQPAIIGQLITSMTAMLYGKLNRARTYSQTFTRTFDGVGTMQLLLPDFPVTGVTSVQMGQTTIPASMLGVPPSAGVSAGYGYRFVPWSGNLPGDPCVLEFVNGYFWTGAQNIKVTYQAGYLITDEPWTVPPVVPLATNPVITVLQPQGIWCRDNGVAYASSGQLLTPVTASPTQSQYIPPSDTAPGLYTFNVADVGQALLISYSFIPADLSEACNQMVAERYSYRNRVGELAKSLGGQETVRWMRGGMGPPYNRVNALPPEVADLINPYIYVAPPAIGAPV